MDEYLADCEAKLAKYKFIVIGVSGDGRPNTPGWAYTVGLLDAADHPEVIVVGLGYNSACRLLNQIAAGVLKGERFLVGESIASPEHVLHVGAVHRVQYQLETFNMWRVLQQHGVICARELEAVQILLPLGARPRGAAQPFLSQAGARIAP